MACVQRYGGVQEQEAGAKPQHIIAGAETALCPPPPHTHSLSPCSTSWVCLELLKQVI